MTTYQERLFALRDLNYLEFNSGLIPTVDKERMIGVRNPEVRKLAKQIASEGDFQPFLKELPHYYYEENGLHAELIRYIGRDFDVVQPYVEAFLPYIDNWAVCDCFKVPCYERNKNKLLPVIKKWLASKRTYTVRFALVNLMRYFLEDDFTYEILELSSFKSEDYYIAMAQAWLFSVALMKQYDTAIIFFYEHRLSCFVHNKALQKARESLRVDEERKKLFQTLKVKEP